jgi:hypothetical protein
LLFKNDFKNNILLNKQEIIFNKGSRTKKFRHDILSKSFIKTKYNSTTNSISLFNDDCLSVVNNISKKNFKFYSSETAIDSMDDSYNNLKYVYNSLYNNKNFSSLINLNFIAPISYTHILNAFRGNYEEFC